MKILLADDEQSIHAVVERIVTDDGHEFCAAFDGIEALEVMKRESPDLAILDVMMPRLNGFDVCSRLRFDGYQTPVLFLTAKGDIVDKSIGFKSGGDDYLVKPFIAEELSLRINALLKRKGNLAGEVHIPEQMIYKGLEIYPTRFKAFVDGRQIDLTPKEFRILALLASRPGEVFTREQLIENVWGEEFVGESSGITGFIRKIREKIETDPSRPFYVQTVWKIGYRLGD